jgi:hypothetical protein
MKAVLFKTNNKARGNTHGLMVMSTLEALWLTTAKGKGRWCISETGLLMKAGGKKTKDRAMGHKNIKTANSRAFSSMIRSMDLEFGLTLMLREFASLLALGCMT